VTFRPQADRLLAALAQVDLAAVDAACADDVVVFGTDVGEEWSDRGSLLAALEPMRALGLRARWRGEPLARGCWVAGDAEFLLPDGTRVGVRVTMVFAEGLLAHAHYSIPADPA
jgi:SnoaL-like domain